MSTSTTQTPSGRRLPRFAEAAVERARLTVVPARSLGRTQAARTPFAVLVLVILTAGVVGLLMFNTQMQQTSFTATALQERATDLTARKQALDLELDGLRDPQQLAQSARDLGMVTPEAPAFLRLGDGRILGTPLPASAGDSVQVTPGPARKPAQIERRTVIVEATPRRGAGDAAQDEQANPSGDTPGASAATAP